MLLKFITTAVWYLSAGLVCIALGAGIGHQLVWHVAKAKYRKQLHTVQAKYDARSAAHNSEATIMESFTLGWLNLIVQSMWVPVIEKYVSALTAEKLQVILNEVLVKNTHRKPWKYMSSITINEVTFGLVPPQFQYCYAKYDPKTEILQLSMNLRFSSNGFQAVLTPRSRQMGMLQPFSLKLEISHLFLAGRLNLGLQLTKEPPGIKGVHYSFASEPEFDIKASPVGMLSLSGDLPGLVSGLRSSLANVISKRLVEPNRRYLDLQRLYRNKHVLKVGGPGGLLRVSIIGARDLLPRTPVVMADVALAALAAKRNTTGPAMPNGTPATTTAHGTAGAAFLPAALSTKNDAASMPDAAAAARAAAAVGRTCDAYLELRFGREVFRTPIVHSTASPVWNWQFDVKLPEDIGCPTLDGRMRIDILDALTVGDPELLCSATFNLHQLSLEVNAEPQPMVLPLTTRTGQPRGALQLQLAWQKAVKKGAAVPVPATDKAGAAASGGEGKAMASTASIGTSVVRGDAKAADTITVHASAAPPTSPFHGAFPDASIDPSSVGFHEPVHAMTAGSAGVSYEPHNHVHFTNSTSMASLESGTTLTTPDASIPLSVASGISVVPSGPSSAPSHPPSLPSKTVSPRASWAHRVVSALHPHHHHHHNKDTEHAHKLQHKDGGKKDRSSPVSPHSNTVTANGQQSSSSSPLHTSWHSRQPSDVSSVTSMPPHSARDSGASRTFAGATATSAGIAWFTNGSHGSDAIAGGTPDGKGREGRTRANGRHKRAISEVLSSWRPHLGKKASAAQVGLADSMLQLLTVPSNSTRPASASFNTASRSAADDVGSAAAVSFVSGSVTSPGSSGGRHLTLDMDGGSPHHAPVSKVVSRDNAALPATAREELALNTGGSAEGNYVWLNSEPSLQPVVQLPLPQTFQLSSQTSLQPSLQLEGFVGPQDSSEIQMAAHAGLPHRPTGSLDALPSGITAPNDSLPTQGNSLITAAEQPGQAQRFEGMTGPILSSMAMSDLEEVYSIPATSPGGLHHLHQRNLSAASDLSSSSMPSMLLNPLPHLPFALSQAAELQLTSQPGAAQPAAVTLPSSAAALAAAASASAHGPSHKTLPVTPAASPSIGTVPLVPGSTALVAARAPANVHVFNPLQSLAQVVKIQRVVQQERQRVAELTLQLQEVKRKYDAIARLRRAENRRALLEGAAFQLYTAKEVRQVSVWYSEGEQSLHVREDELSGRGVGTGGRNRSTLSAGGIGTAQGASLGGAPGGVATASPAVEEWPHVIAIKSIARVELGSTLFPAHPSWAQLKALFTGRARNSSASNGGSSGGAAGSSALPQLDARSLSLRLHSHTLVHLQLPPHGNGRSRDEWVAGVQDLMSEAKHATAGAKASAI